MPNITKDFDKYILAVNSGTTTKASITCYRGNTQVGMLAFCEKSNIQKPRYQSSMDRIFLYFHIDQLEAVLKILQNEKPLQLYISTAAGWGRLKTGLEPVGEEESP
ncbi:MAG: hypothetical protein ABIK92_16775 [Pseudomonadota bacterium]